MEPYYEPITGEKLCPFLNSSQVPKEFRNKWIKSSHVNLKVLMTSLTYLFWSCFKYINLDNSNETGFSELRGRLQLSSIHENYCVLKKILGS